MCFSASLSLLSFTLGITGSILVYTLDGPSNKIIAMFLGFVSFMQLIEYLLWIHQICDDYNKLLSKIGMWLNQLQPIVLGLLVLIFNNSEINNNINEYSSIFYKIFEENITSTYTSTYTSTTTKYYTLLMLKDESLKYKLITLYSIVAFPFFIYQNYDHKMTTVVSKLGHLNWKWNGLNYSKIIYNLFFCSALILLFYIGLPNKTLKIYACVVTIVTYISSAIIYRNHVGTLWCFYSTLIPFIYYLYCRLFNKFVGV